MTEPTIPDASVGLAAAAPAIPSGNGDLAEPTEPSAPREPSDSFATEAETVAGVAGRRVSRRQVLKFGAAALPCLAGSVAINRFLAGVVEAPAPPIDPLVARYDASAHRWGFVVDVGACIGCGQCVIACKEENGVPFDEEHTRTWVERRSIAADGTLHVDSPEAGIRGFPPEPEVEGLDPADVESTQFVPRLCMQCENSPCTTVCPVGATFRTQDGVILVDEDRCIGCGYCVVACPYGARYLVPAGARTPTGVAGVADKCTFCYHRITRGREPACVEICPVGARQFGDLNNPDSVVSSILREEPTQVLKPELGTNPRVHYLNLRGDPT